MQPVSSLPARLKQPTRGTALWFLNIPLRKMKLLLQGRQPLNCSIFRSVPDLAHEDLPEHDTFTKRVANIPICFARQTS